jgi:CheY-like chemotaxis protein
MPVMNGAELVERLRADARLRDVPVVLTTAAMPTQGTPVPRVTALLPKPFELDALLAAVARHCRRTT